MKRIIDGKVYNTEKAQAWLENRDFDEECIDVTQLLGEHDELLKIYARIAREGGEKFEHLKQTMKFLDQQSK